MSNHQERKRERNESLENPMRVEKKNSCEKKVKHNSLNIKKFCIHVFVMSSLYKLIAQRDSGI